ncbi:MAG: hypothetical protein J7K88_12390 [Candidatus Fermentibacteraceae bacterium]|nr:hypothetical protein [Candidatus Fermentibacteraceae bacterium]
MSKPFLFVAVVVLAFPIACGGAGEPAAESDSGTQVTDEAETVVEEVVLYPAGTLDPRLVTADDLVAAGDLFESFYAWNGQTVVLQGYPFSYYGDSTVIEDDLELVAVAEDREVLAAVAFAEPLNITVPTGEAVTVSGTVEYSWTGEVELVAGAVVPDAPSAVEMELSPYAYDGVSPIAVQDFFEAFNVWIGKEVTVNGYYISTTTSVLSSGDVVRIDLSDGASGSKCVACEMGEEISQPSGTAMLENRDNTQIRGTITGESFNMVGLEGCELVNR